MVIAKVGDILCDSWGYGMTINEFCIVIGVNPSGKTIKCRMIGKRTISGDSREYGSEVPDPEHTFGTPFNLHVRQYDGREYYVGSHPFTDDNTKRKGSFDIWKGKPLGFNYMD